MLRFFLFGLFAVALCGTAQAQYFDGLPVAGSGSTPPLSSGNIVPVCQGGTTGRPGTCKPVQTTLGAIVNFPGSTQYLPFSGGTMTGALHMGAHTLDGSAAAFTGGTLSGLTITNTPISGSTGAFSTLSATNGGSLAGTFNASGAWNFAAGAVLGGGPGTILTVNGSDTVQAAQFSGPATFASIASLSASNVVQFKNGPFGAVMAQFGGTDSDFELGTNMTLPGGTWGSEALANSVAPILQNTTFAGSTTAPAAAFGMFLQQTDNSSNTGGSAVGILEHLILNGSGVVGSREGAQINLDISATTGNTNGQDYVGIGSQCNLMATDPGGTPTRLSSCFGNNPVSHVGANVHASQLVGAEVDTWAETGAVITDRIGLQVVDVQGATYGTQASSDDVGLSVNNQYAPSSTLGYKIGLEFGRAGGFFGVATNGTLIYGQGNQGAAFTVANGIDWHLGTATGDWLKFGSVFSVAGDGNTSIGGTLNIGNTINLGTAVAAGSNVTLQTPNGSNIVLNPQGSGTVSILSPMSAEIANIGGINVPMGGAEPTPILNITAGLNGTVTGSGVTQWNNISVSADTASIPNAMADLATNHNFGGVGFSGGRIGFLANMVQTGAIAGTPGVFGNVVSGIQSSVTLNNSFGGSGTTPSTAAGYATGLNPYLSFTSGFTNGGGGSGEEIDVGTASGASFMDAIGLLVTRLDNGSQGARADAGIVIGGATPSAGHGWKTGLSFGYGSGDAGIDPGGTLIGTDAATGLSAANGIDFSAWTFTGAALRMPGFTVDGNGNASVHKITVAAMPTSCSGQATGTIINNAGVANVCP